MQEVPWQSSRATATATVEQPTAAASLPAVATSQPPSTPPPSPQPLSWQSPEPEEAKSGKGLILSLVSLIILVLIGGALYWVFLREKESGLAANPQEIFINGIEKVVMAKDFHVEWVMKPWDFAQMQAVGYEQGLATYGKYLDPADTKLILSGDSVNETVTSTNADITLQLQSPSAGTDITMKVRSLNGKLFMQIASFSMKDVPFDLSPILNTWVDLDLNELLTNSFLVATLSPGEIKSFQANPFNYLVVERAQYFAIFKEAYQKHTPLVLQTIPEKSMNGVTVLAARGDTEKGKAFVRDFLPKVYVQVLSDVDAAIVRAEKEGNTAAVESLREFRAEAVKEYGEDGSKLEKLIDEEFSSEKKKVEMIKKDPLVGDTAILFPFEETPAPAPTFVEATGELTYENRTGRMVGVTVFLTYKMPESEENKTIELVSGTYSKYNSGITIAKPEKPKTIKEMLPLIIGVIATGQLFPSDMATTTIELQEVKGELMPFTEPIDTDGDGADDLTEQVWGSDPQLKDTDGDGYDDFSEVKNGFDPRGPGRIPADKLEQFSY